MSSDADTRNILITGRPGIGKTTLVRNLAGHLSHKTQSGFYTAEIREGGVRQGFELISFDGPKSILSHVNIKGRHRVGKYDVDVTAFENFLRNIDFFDSSIDLIIIDEIGKMECLSDYFRKLIIKILDCEKTLIAVIALKGAGIISEIKQRSDVISYELTHHNRGTLLSQILSSL